jgi:SAM-dependent methyltransferase
MSKKVDLFYNTYGHFSEQVLAEIRKDTYGEDIGQNSWITTEEYDTFYSWLNPSPNDHLLEIACGSGGPTLYLARKFKCHITGLDINEEGIKTANQQALDSRQQNVSFRLADVTRPLLFDDQTFDAVMCMDSANHFGDRPWILQEWYRVLKPGRRILFTDPVVITGPVSNEELASRSSIGFFIFMPLQVTENMIKEAGFKLIRREDVTGNIELTSGRWYASREKHHEDLLKIENDELYEGVQKFLATVHKLTSERRLSRFVFLAEK